jgi:hypothetical protein
MIVMRFGPGPLPEARFAVSPLIETIRSIRALDDRSAHSLHARWAAEARNRTRHLDLSVLRALQPPDTYAPDFLHPPPGNSPGQFGDELKTVADTPPEQVIQEITRTYPAGDLPPVLKPFLDDPAAAVAGLTGLLQDYWDLALARPWPRLRALLQGDVLYRACQMVAAGRDRMLGELDDTLSWSDGKLLIKKSCCEATVDLGERELLFVPSAFAWPQAVVIHDRAWQPTIIYPARGAATLWERAQRPQPPMLAALIGRRRAALLLALNEPRSTVDLAKSVGLSPGGVSQHLAVMRNAGLLDKQRVRREVLYWRSPAGDSLLTAATTVG